MLFLILAPYDNEQSDLIHRVSEEKTLDEIPLYRYIVLVDALDCSSCSFIAHFIAFASVLKHDSHIKQSLLDYH